MDNDIDGYEIIKTLGKGGMGEVFLAKDLTLNRLVAIKKIRKDLSKHKILQDRFMKEARITASLYHPSIIPVFTINQTEKETYYTMPFVEGITLKELLKKTIDENDNTFVTMSSLIDIFLSVCRAISYCHSQGVLHRDLKPENVLVGNYGQTILFDLGLCRRLDEKEEVEEVDLDDVDPNLTRPGKVLGTLAYMPPEYIAGKNIDYSIDIYALGVILYQILTLKMPFSRKNIKQYKKIGSHEKLIDALEVAPERDIPPKLADIAKKALSVRPEDRYSSVDELITSLIHYREGLPDWVFSRNLKIETQTDWAFQENVLLNKVISFNQNNESSQWYFLMISEAKISGNQKIETLISLDDTSQGIGFLINAKRPKSREPLKEGYLVWIGSKNNPGIKLYRNNICVFELSDVAVSKGMIAIEKMDRDLRVILDGKAIINYHDPLFVIGQHVGILSQDFSFTVEKFEISVASQSALVKCLSVPDALFTSKHFMCAYKEYCRIASSFAGTREVRDAIFRSGLCLIEEAKTISDPISDPISDQDKIGELTDRALKVFDSLNNSVQDPYEALGKSLVYSFLGNIDEEAKALELGLRKFNSHPSKHLIEERVIYRLHECAINNRKGMYLFSFLVLRHMPQRLIDRDTHSLIHTLFTYLDRLTIFEDPRTFSNLDQKYLHMALQLAFWLDKPLLVEEIRDETDDEYIKDLATKTLATLADPKNLSTQPADAEQLKKFLSKGKTLKAKEILDKYLPEKSKSTSIFFTLQGCYLALTEGKEASHNHLKKAIDYHYFPLSSLLSSHLKGKLSLNDEKLFTFEQLELTSQLELFNQCLKIYNTSSV